MGGLYTERAGCAARARGITPRRGRRTCAAECARRVCASRWSDLAVGRSGRRHHCVRSGRCRPVLRSRRGQGIPPPAVLQGAERRARRVSEASVVPAPPSRPNVLFEYLLRCGDDRLVLGHRLSEWCGHGPILEEDIALANMSLDLLGQARMILTYAGEVEGKKRDEDALAYSRDERDYRNLLITEQPNGDFGQTILRQFLFSAYTFF